MSENAISNEGGAEMRHEAAAESTGFDDQPLPKLYSDSAFWGMTATQFFGAFNDNLFKQLMLLLAVPVGISSFSEKDEQGLATIVFSLPFVLFSGLAGFWSDKYSKRPIIVLSKVAEIVVMLMGLFAFAAYGWFGYQGLLCVLFLMGLQSTFFGPGKYGILPEMLRPTDLPRANAVMLMTTFLAIILGTASAGLIGDWFVDDSKPLDESAPHLWMGSLICVAIAVIGTITSLWIRRVQPAKPDLKFVPTALAIPPETRQLLRKDRPMLLAIAASCMFWMVAGIAIQAVNSLGLVQLEIGKIWTSVLTAIIGLGIAIGAIIAGRLCHGRADPRTVSIGLWGMTAFMLLISISLPGGRHLLGFVGSLPVLVLMGMCAGLFAIPVQVFIQLRPPKGQKGRMIAVMNQANFVAILLSGILYSVFDRIVEFLHWPRSPIFAMMAILLLPVAIFYRLPDDQETVSA